MNPNKQGDKRCYTYVHCWSRSTFVFSSLQAVLLFAVLFHSSITRCITSGYGFTTVYGTTVGSTLEHRVKVAENRVTEIGVAIMGQDDAALFALSERDITAVLAQVTRSLDLHAPYETEINLSTRALVASLSQMLTRGVLLFIDYGFPAREFTIQRETGTLMCHDRHHAHSDPLVLPGLQDITAHVDFSAVASAALSGGAQVLGYVC
jgi:SAM-dependent MidA family methyltransferase